MTAWLSGSAAVIKVVYSIPTVTSILLGPSIVGGLLPTKQQHFIKIEYLHVDIFACKIFAILRKSGLPTVPYPTVQYRILTPVPAVPYGTGNVPFLSNFVI